MEEEDCGGSSSSLEPPATAEPEPASTSDKSRGISWADASDKALESIQSLSTILPSLPPSLSTSQDPALSLLHDPDLSSQISSLLRQPNAGAGDNHLCRWLYDTFQSSHPSLQLVVLRFLPVISGVYLSGVARRQPLAGFEAVLLAVYAHETTSRNGQSITVSIPDLSHSSIYHETKISSKNNATELNLAVISPTLEPHGTVRSTRRARIVGVALELYFSKISEMPLDSKIEFCEFCVQWAGQDGDMYRDGPDTADHADNPEAPSQNADPDRDETQNPEISSTDEEKRKDESENQKAEEGKRSKEGRIPMPWELLQPVLRILGHCLLGPDQSRKELKEAAGAACRSLYARSVHDINPKAILATGSLLRLCKIELESSDDIDHTEITMTSVINL